MHVIFSCSVPSVGYIFSFDIVALGTIEIITSQFNLAAECSTYEGNLTWLQNREYIILSLYQYNYCNLVKQGLNYRKPGQQKQDTYILSLGPHCSCYRYLNITAL